MDGEIGVVISGIAVLMIACVICWFMYHVTRFYKAYADKEERYTYLEIGLIRKIAEKLDIDLEYERFKTEFLKPVKSIRKEIEQQILDEMIKATGDDKSKQTKLDDFKKEET